MKSLTQSLLPRRFQKTNRSQDRDASATNAAAAEAAAAEAPNNANNTGNATAAPGAARVKLLAYLRHVTWIVRVARRVPITSVLIVVAWVMWLLARNTSPQRAYGLTSDMAGQSWRFLTSGLTEKTFPALLIATVVLVVLGSAAEYMLGSRQYLGFSLVLHVFSVIGMLVTRDVMVVCRSSWAKAWLTEPFLSQIPWVFGVATVASSHFGRLWRRRLLVVLLVITGFCRGCGAADGGGCWGGDVADAGAGFVAAEFASGVSAAHCRGVCDDCRRPVDDFGESGF